MKDLQSAPTAVGTYDVIITRAEDDTYEAFSQTITGGLVITAADYPVSVVADKETMRGAGTVKLTADSTVDEIKVTGIVQRMKMVHILYLCLMQPKHISLRHRLMGI